MIGSNPLLTTIDELRSLQTIGGGYYFTFNPELTSIEFESLVYVGAASQFDGNAKLPYCEMCPLVPLTPKGITAMSCMEDACAPAQSWDGPKCP
jgi:hypothetical protein